MRDTATKNWPPRNGARSASGCTLWSGADGLFPKLCYTLASYMTDLPYSTFLSQICVGMIGPNTPPWHTKCRSLPRSTRRRMASRENTVLAHRDFPAGRGSVPSSSFSPLMPAASWTAAPFSPTPPPSAESAPSMVQGKARGMVTSKRCAKKGRLW